MQLYPSPGTVVDEVYEPSSRLTRSGRDLADLVREQVASGPELLMFVSIWSTTPPGTAFATSPRSHMRYPARLTATYLTLSAKLISLALVAVVLTPIRSEERRVGKECRSRWSPDH